MGIQVNQLAVVIPGQVTRKYDADTDTTSIAVNYEQAKELNESTARVLEFFGNNTGVPAPAASPDPDQLAIDGVTGDSLDGVSVAAGDLAPVGKAGRAAVDNPQA